MKKFVKLYTIYTEDGGFWLDPKSPFITEELMYAEAVLKLYLTHTGKLNLLDTEKAKVVALDIEEKVFYGTDERVVGPSELKNEQTQQHEKGSC